MSSEGRESPEPGAPGKAAAMANMEAFVADATLELGRAITFNAIPYGKEGGRWFFHVTDSRGPVHEVGMPGVPLARVRYLREEGQQPWDYERVWVDGYSWLWIYAVGAVGAARAEVGLPRRRNRLG